MFLTESDWRLLLLQWLNFESLCQQPSFAHLNADLAIKILSNSAQLARAAFAAPEDDVAVGPPAASHASGVQRQGARNAALQAYRDAGIATFGLPLNEQGLQLPQVLTDLIDAQFCAANDRWHALTQSANTARALLQQCPNAAWRDRALALLDSGKAQVRLALCTWSEASPDTEVTAVSQHDKHTHLISEHVWVECHDAQDGPDIATPDAENQVLYLLPARSDKPHVQADGEPADVGLYLVPANVKEAPLALGANGLQTSMPWTAAAVSHQILRLGALGPCIGFCMHSATARPTLLTQFQRRVRQTNALRNTVQAICRIQWLRASEERPPLARTCGRAYLWARSALLLALYGAVLKDRARDGEARAQRLHELLAPVTALGGTRFAAGAATLARSLPLPKARNVALDSHRRVPWESASDMFALELSPSDHWLQHTVLSNQAQALQDWGSDLRSLLTRAGRYPELKAACEALAQSSGALLQGSIRLHGLLLHGPAEQALAQSSRYLEALTSITLAALWLDVAFASHDGAAGASEWQSGCAAFFAEELPRVFWILERLGMDEPILTSTKH